jgi:hypothetical protein
MLNKLLCKLGFHKWYYEPEEVRGYGNQPIYSRGCTRRGCDATQFKENGGKWKNSTKDKFREYLWGAKKKGLFN